VGCLGGCLARLFLTMSVLTAVIVGWFFGPVFVSGIEGILSDRGSIRQGSSEVAEDAFGRLSRFQKSESGTLLSFNAEEVVSLLMHSGDPVLPDVAIGLGIEMIEGMAVASSRIAKSDFPDMIVRREMSAFLPDTVSITLEGSLIPLTNKEIGFAIYGAQISFISLPVQVIPQLLSFFGIDTQDGYPGSVFRIPLPNGVSGAYILHDRLYLTR
jgi:hypothetical protein